MNFIGVNNYNDFVEKCHNITKKEKGNYFELLNKYTLLLHYTFNGKIKECWLYEEIPYDITKELKLPKNDKGIDLVVRYTDNTYGVVQSKYRTNIDEVVTYGELATFFAQILEQKGRVKAVYMTNTRSIVDEIVKNEVLSFNYDFFKTLDKEFFDNVRNHISNNKKPKYSRKIPRNYQIKCVDLALNFIEFNPRSHLIMACGTGKSFVSFLIDEKLKNKKTVIFVPSLYLLTQMYLTFVKENYGKCEYLLVGSDADLKNEKHDYQQVEITTKREAIKNKMKTNKKLVVICTYQSSELLEGYEFDFGIFDEAHKTVGNKDSHFSFALFDNNIEIPRRLFITATKRVYNGKNEEIVHMNDEKMYGPCIFEYNIRQGIDEGFLSEYVIEIMNIDDHVIKKHKVDNVLVDDDDECLYGSHFIACMLMIKQLFEKGDINHLLTYHSSIEKAKEFGQLIKKHCSEISVYHLNGSYSCTRRNKIIESFCKKGKAIITSSQVLNEGVDIPIVDSVCFVEGRNSEINIIQCIGRALRKFENKKLAHILVPITDSELDESRVFGNLIKIIKTLGDHDNLLIEYFKTKNNGGTVNKKLVKVRNYDDREVEEVPQVNSVVFANKVDTVIYESVISRLEKTVSYEQVRWIIRNLDINNKETYFEWCKKDYRIPKEPEKTFGSKFTGWIDYFSIPRDYYELDECIKYVNKYLKRYPELKKETLNLSKVCEKLCELDENFPPNGLWSDYYSKNLYEIIELEEGEELSVMF